MKNVIDFCKSDKFLSGGATELEKQFQFPGKRPWIRRKTGVFEYLAAIERGEAEDPDETSWHILERYISELKVVITKVNSLGCGPVIDQLKVDRSELSNLLSTDTRIRSLAEAIGRLGNIDGERLLYESLGEAPYGHLIVAHWIQMLLPQVVFPFLVVLRDAYADGLFPFGAFNTRLDPNYGGPDVLLCIDPDDLELTKQR